MAQTFFNLDQNHRKKVEHNCSVQRNKMTKGNRADKPSQCDIEKLVARLSALHMSNKQFSEENERLRDEIIQYSASNATNRLEAENHDLREDLQMMKTLVYRLNVQLENYQMILRTEQPKTVLPTSNVSTEVEFGPQNWGTVNRHTLSPLLNAYQAALSARDDLVQEHEQHLAVFSGQLRDVVADNERLIAEATGAKQDIAEWQTNRARLQTQLDHYRTKADIQCRRADLAREKLVEVIRCYEQKCQALSSELERVGSAYTRARMELAAIKSDPEIADSVRECHLLLDQLKNEQQCERKKLADELEMEKATSDDLLRKMKVAERERDDLQELVSRQRDCNIVLTEKNTKLQSHLTRLRKSRESLRIKLKTISTTARSVDGPKSLFNYEMDFLPICNYSTSNVPNYANRSTEIDQLNRRLQQREDTLRKILQQRVRPLAIGRRKYINK